MASLPPLPFEVAREEPYFMRVLSVFASLATQIYKVDQNDQVKIYQYRWQRWQDRAWGGWDIKNFSDRKSL